MGWDWGGVGSGAMSGAGTGAALGPWGALAGGIGGGLLGGFKGGQNANPDPQVENFYGAIPNTQGPLGGQTWARGPNGQMSSTLGFSGPAQGVWDSLLGGMQRAADYDPTQARDAAIKSNYDQAMSRLNPRLQQQQGQFNAVSANSGLEPGTEAYNNANLQLQQGQNDALNSAMANAIRQGNETQAMQIQQMNQPFNQAGSMMEMLQRGQGNNLNAPLVAAGMAQKANDNAADRASANSAGKKGGAGSLLGGMGGKKGGRSKAPADQNMGYDANLGGYNF